MQKGYFEERRQKLNMRSQGWDQSLVSLTTMNSANLNTSFNFKVETMKPDKLAANMPELTLLIRMDAGSFFSKWRRFKVFVGVKSGPDDAHPSLRLAVHDLQAVDLPRVSMASWCSGCSAKCAVCYSLLLLCASVDHY